ncbi:hypothetical protein MMC26_000808 [Xylographa opegraphella]|nr:hypothetical protein [Xylographa opegraphella]
MGANTRSDIHPFFTGIRSKGSRLDPPTENTVSFVANSQVELRSPANSAQSLRDPQLRQTQRAGNTSAGQYSQNTSLIQNRNPLNLLDRVVTTGPQQSSRHTERAYKETRENPKINLTIGHSNDGSQPTGENGESLFMHGSSPDVEIDPNGDRRKRRRTASVELDRSVEGIDTPKTWEEQLRAAASSTLAPKDRERDQLSHIDEDLNTRLHPGPAFPLSHDKSNKAQAVEVSTSLDRSTIAGRGNPSAMNGTPKKKMLKLHNDGRLASPTSRKVVDISRPDAKPRGRRKKETSSTKILVLSYGSDSATKASIAQRINIILESPIASKELSRSTGVSDVVPQPNVATKVTHPFFLGKVARQSVIDVNHNTESAIAEDEGPPKDSKSASPRKKVSTVTPTVANAWAAIAEHGFATEARATSRMMRFAGAMEPLWPPRGLQHCRGLTAEPPVMHTRSSGILVTEQRRFKTSEPQIHPGESILDICRRAYYGFTKHGDWTVVSSRSRILRKPYRRLMTGLELQAAMRSRLVTWNPPAANATSAAHVDSNVFHDGVMDSVQRLSSHHSALDHLYGSLATSLSGFDRFECETRDWTSKYMPRDAASVLQQSSEVTLLRDWLKSLTVMSVNNGTSDCQKSRETSITSKRLLAKRKKRRKMAEYLEDFVVSSDSEVDRTDELAQPDANPSIDVALRSAIIRNEDRAEFSGQTGVTPVIANAVVISGPHGCGKTAAVYAVAQELGFEVFEINAGSRRSGRDVLDRVGDMTKNHLVQKATHTDKMEDAEALQNAALQEDISSGHQSTMQSFLKQDNKSKSTFKSRSKAKEVEPKAQVSPKKRNHQKQSLILLEEVDILFDEDKLFWTTVLSLILQSRRPIIMTCTDESLLPLDDMLLHAIFHFVPPPDDLATDYLMLVAGNEGHLLSRESIATLYRAKQRDVRASITELNFWCQMAVGDAKGGLEWMLIRANADESHNKQGQALRVVSDGTYVPYMGFLGRDRIDDSTDDTMSREIKVLAEASDAWDHTVEEWYQLLDDDSLFSHSSLTSRQRSLQMLDDCVLNFDAQSAADVLQGFGLRPDHITPLDATEPELTDTARSNYTEGFHVLQAEPRKDQTCLSQLIPLAIKACSKKVISESVGDAATHFNADVLCQHITRARSEGSRHPFVAPMAGLIGVALKSLEEPSKRSSLHAASSQAAVPGASLSSIVCDIAPYVRSIVRYDICLEERRVRLSDLLSHGGRSGKPRRTRASRAALEGGSKAHTRRERWFPKSTNFGLVLQTGGEEWQRAGATASQQQSKQSDEDGMVSGGTSRRSSIDTGSSEA